MQHEKLCELARNEIHEPFPTTLIGWDARFWRAFLFLRKRVSKTEFEEAFYEVVLQKTSHGGKRMNSTPRRRRQGKD
jgi:hypothetical protein